MALGWSVDKIARWVLRDEEFTESGDNVNTDVDVGEEKLKGTGTSKTASPAVSSLTGNGASPKPQLLQANSNSKFHMNNDDLTPNYLKFQSGSATSSSSIANNNSLYGNSSSRNPNQNYNFQLEVVNTQRKVEEMQAQLTLMQEVQQSQFEQMQFSRNSSGNDLVCGHDRTDVGSSGLRAFTPEVSTPIHEEEDEEISRNDDKDNQSLRNIDSTILEALRDLSSPNTTLTRLKEKDDETYTDIMSHPLLRAVNNSLSPNSKLKGSARLQRESNVALDKLGRFEMMNNGEEIN